VDYREYDHSASCVVKASRVSVGKTYIVSASSAVTERGEVNVIKHCGTGIMCGKTVNCPIG
jgi:hypothetical protein